MVTPKVREVVGHTVARVLAAWNALTIPDDHRLPRTGLQAFGDERLETRLLLRPGPLAEAMLGGAHPDRVLPTMLHEGVVHVAAGVDDPLPDVLEFSFPADALTGEHVE